MTSRGWTISPTKRDGQFLLRYKQPETGKWRQHRIPIDVSTKRDAERYAKQWYDTFKAELEKPTAVEIPKDDGPTIAELAAKWLELRERLLRNGRIRPATLKQDQGCMGKHILPALGTTPVYQLGTGELREFIRQLSEKRAPHTVRNVASVVKTLLDDVIAEEHWAPRLEQNPMRTKAVRRELPPPRKLSGATKIKIPLAHVEALLRAEDVPVHRKMRYLLAATSGLRDGELSGLTWSAVRLDERIAFLAVDQSLSSVGGLMPPKTLNGHREIPIHPVVVDGLRWWWSTGWTRWVGRKPSQRDPVFPDRRGRWWRPRSGDLLRADLAAAGCPTECKGYPITFHALRRTFSTALQKSRRVKDLTKDVLMGHAHKKVDHDCYADTDMEAKAEAIKTIELALKLDDLLADHRHEAAE